MRGLQLRAADDDSTSLSATDGLGRSRFSADGTGISAAQGSGTSLAAATGTGQGLREGAGQTSGMSRGGLAAVGGMILQSIADQQAQAADQASARVRPMQWRDPERSTLGEELMTSTKKAKEPSKRGLGAVQRGRRGLDPIDTNGVKMMDIQKKHQYAEQLRSKLAKLKAKKGAK